MEEDEEGEEREALKWLKPQAQYPVGGDRRDQGRRGSEEGLEQEETPLKGEEKEREETSSSSYEFSKDSIEG